MRCGAKRSGGGREEGRKGGSALAWNSLEEVHPSTYKGQLSLYLVDLTQTLVNVTNAINQRSIMMEVVLPTNRELLHAHKHR